MDTKYGIHLTSSDVVREAKEFLLNTNRPETPFLTRAESYSQSQGDHALLNSYQIEQGNF
jgi:hypothetical protein